MCDTRLGYYSKAREILQVAGTNSREDQEKDGHKISKMAGRKGAAVFAR